MVEGMGPTRGNVAVANARLQKAAQDFEAMLIQDLLTLSDSGSTPDPDRVAGQEQYQDFRNQAVATAMAHQGGIGIARLLVQQLQSKGQY